MDRQNRGGRGGRGRGGKRGGRGGKTLEQIERDKQRELRLTGLVRSVQSGDTLTLLEIDKNKPNPAEISLSLIGIKAPQLGRRTKKGKKEPAEITKDQAYAWQSREYLRNLLHGKVVVYRIEYELELEQPAPVKRVLGEVWLGTQNIRFKIVEDGWAKTNIKPPKVKEGQLPPLPRKEDEEIRALEEKARAKKAGVWAGDENTPGAVRNIKYRDDASLDEQFSFYERLKKKPLKAIVEQVKQGSTLRVYLPDTQDDVTLSLSGVRSPTYKPKELEKTEPFGLEAKMMTEHLVLNKNVTLTLDTLDKFNIFATVIYGENQNLAVDLLARGLAQVVDWSIADKNLVQDWKTIEGKAKAQNLKMWKNTPQTKEKTQQRAAIVGQVVEVTSPGTIVVRIVKENRVDDRKFNFSSIKVPLLPPKKKDGQQAQNVSAEEAETKEGEKKVGEVKKDTPKDSPKPQPQKGQQKKGQQAQKEVKDDGKTDAEREAEAKQKQQDAKLKKDAEAAWAIEAKEYLRTKLVGKTVRCEWDYVIQVKKDKDQKDAPPEWRQFHSIYLGKENVALDLVTQGYAKVQPHPEGAPRAREYQDMVQAERLAATTNLRYHGVHGGAIHNAPFHKLTVNDLTENEYYPMKNQDAKKGQKKGEEKKPDEKKPDEKGEKKGEKKEGKPRGDPTRNRSFAEELKKTKRVSAVVEYVVSGGRFKVFVPGKGYFLTLGLSGIRADAKVKFGGPDVDKENMLRAYPMHHKDGNPCFPNIAFHKARDALLQRDVEIEVEGIDVGGGFVGRLFYKPEVVVEEEKAAPAAAAPAAPAGKQGGKQPAGKQPQQAAQQPKGKPAPAPALSGKDIIGKDALHDWGLKLLEEGYAALSPFAERVITDPALMKSYSNAQREAQDNKRNIWWNFNRQKYEAELKEKERQEAGADEEEDDTPPVYERVQVTEIMTGSNFFYQLANAATDHSLQELSSAFAGCNFEGLPEYSPEPPKDKKDPKEMVAGRFTVDGTWYRAEVIRYLSNNDPPQFELRYIDYGNTEIVTAANIRKLPPEIASVGGGKGLAYKARLAHLTAPSLDEDYGRDAAAFFKELVWGKTMRANIRQSRRTEVRQVSLGDEETGLVINGQLVKEGLARVDRSGPISKKVGKKTEYEVLKEAEAEAIQKHLNIWEYGELPDSGDERAFANILR